MRGGAVCHIRVISAADSLRIPHSALRLPDSKMAEEKGCILHYSFCLLIPLLPSPPRLRRPPLHHCDLPKTATRSPFPADLAAQGSLRVASGWLQGAYRLATRWPECKPESGFGGFLHSSFIILHSLCEGGLGGSPHFEHCHHLRRRCRASLPIPIPKGLCPPAQGCEARATLGKCVREGSTPTGLRPGTKRGGRNPVRVGARGAVHPG
jgi:hypothetical protein